MQQTIKTSTNVTRSTSKISKPDSDDKLGINEPYINPTLAGATFRYKGKMYRYNEQEEIVSFYPPGTRKPRTKTKADLK